MAKINNPRKAFQFQIYIPGINPFLCQDVTTSDNELVQVEHGDTNYDVKTAGKVKLGNLMVKKICDSTPLDQAVWIWIKRIQNTLTGGGDLPSQYKATIRVDQYAPDGVTTLKSWFYEGCWPTKINGVELSRMKSENTIEDIQFSVDREI